MSRGHASSAALDEARNLVAKENLRPELFAGPHVVPADAGKILDRLPRASFYEPPDDKCWAFVKTIELQRDDHETNRLCRSILADFAGPDVIGYRKRLVTEGRGGLKTKWVIDCYKRLGLLGKKPVPQVPEPELFP